MISEEGFAAGHDRRGNDFGRSSLNVLVSWLQAVLSRVMVASPPLAKAILVVLATASALAILHAGHATGEFLYYLTHP